jgi:GGDEF domain-containing protein
MMAAYIQRPAAIAPPMQNKSTKPEQQRSTDIAREAFRRLLVRRIAPTPNAYREIYDEGSSIREPLPAEKKRLLITFSGGAALHKPGEDQATLIQRADEVAYKAKRAGKNRVVSAE